MLKESSSIVEPTPLSDVAEVALTGAGHVKVYCSASGSSGSDRPSGAPIGVPTTGT